MTPQQVTVVLNGFWSEFQADALPNDGDVYFAFIGRVIRKPLCVIEKLLYIGPRYVNDKDILQRETLKTYLGNETLEGELFFISGSMTEPLIGKTQLQNILKEHFFACKTENARSELQCPIVVQLVGKVPRLFSGKEKIEVVPDVAVVKEGK